MVKKVLCVIPLLIILFSTYLLYYSNKKEQVISKPDEIYTIKKGYELTNISNTNFYIEVYTNNKEYLFDSLDNNKFYITDKEETTKINLLYIKCLKQDRTETIDNTSFVKTYLYFSLTKNQSSVYIKTAYLVCNNSKVKFKINIGEFNYITSNNTLLNIDKIYPIFNNYYGVNTLVGIVIHLNECYLNKQITNIKISSNYKIGKYRDVSSDISSSTLITSFIKDYDIYDNSNFSPFIYNTKSDLLFSINYLQLIPLESCFFEFEIDGKKYYLDNISFKLSEYNVYDNNDYLEKGVFYD